MLRDLLNDPIMLVPPPAPRPETVLSALDEHYGLAGAVLVSLGGERDRNFRLEMPDGRTLLAKISNAAESEEITDFQIAVLLHLEATDPEIPVPRMIRSRDGASIVSVEDGLGGTFGLRVLTFLDGHPVVGREDDVQLQRRIGRAAARMDLALALWKHRADGRRLLWDIQHAPSLRPLLSYSESLAHRRLAAAALDRFETEAMPRLADLPRQVIHNDLNPHNVLQSGACDAAIAGIIDFGDMVRAPRIQEVATACSYLVGAGSRPGASVLAFIDGYNSVSRLTRSEIELLPVLVSARMAITLAITSWRAAQQPENAAYILRNLPSALRGLEILAADDVNWTPASERER